jgi:hypothetical protein
MRVAALPVCGFLGLDALSKTAVGFDKTTGTIAIWPGGKLSAKEAGEWVTSGAPWPGDSAKPTVWQGDLAFDAQGLPCVEGTIGGKAVSFRIVGYGNALSVPSGDVGSLEFEKLRWPGQSADICLTSGVQVGPERPWTLFTAADTVDGMEPEKPVVPINAFASRRVLLDCAAGRIYAQRLGLRAQAALAFSPLLPAHLEGAVPCVGPCREFPNPDGPRSTKYEGDALLSCFGLDDKAIVELLSVETRLDAEQLKKLASALNGPPLVRLMHEGKVVEIGK